MSSMADLFLNLDYPKVQQEPIRTLSTVRINPRVESVLINNHSIRDIGLLANYKYIRSISLAHLRLDTSLADLLNFVGDANRFPVLREVSIDSVVFQTNCEEYQAPKELSTTKNSSFNISARKRYSHIRKLTICDVFISGKSPIQTFINVASSALNALTLCELKLDLQSQANLVDSAQNDLAHIVGLLIAFPNLQIYNCIQITDQLQSLSHARTAEILLSMRSRLQDAKNLLEDTMLQLTKRGETIKNLKHTLAEIKHEKECLEDEVLSLSTTCATLKSSNLKLSQSNDLLDYLGASVQTLGNTYQSKSSRHATPILPIDSSTSPLQQQSVLSSAAVMVQTDSGFLVPTVSRAVAAHPIRPTISCQESMQINNSLSILNKEPVMQAIPEDTDIFKLLSESAALSKAELQCNRIWMITEDLYSNFSRKIQQKQNEIKILVDALVQVQDEERQSGYRNKAELSRAHRTIANLKSEIEQLRDTVGTVQVSLQDVTIERDDLAANLSQLKNELIVTIENHQAELISVRESAMAEAEAVTKCKMMEANAHIRLLEDTIVSMTDQIKLQEAELAVIEEGYCKKCMASSLTRFETSNSLKKGTNTLSCVATQTNQTEENVCKASVSCQHITPAINKATHTMPTLMIESLYKFEIVSTTDAVKKSAMCQTSSDSFNCTLPHYLLPQEIVHTVDCMVQTDVCPDIGPIELIDRALQAPRLEEALQEIKQQYDELKAQSIVKENEVKDLLQENQRLKECNQKLLINCKKLTTELTRQKEKPRSPRVSSTIDTDNCDVEKTKLLLDLNKALQQRDVYKHNLKKAITYVTKLMSLRAHSIDILAQDKKKHHLLESQDETEAQNRYEQRIAKLQSQVRQLAKNKAEQSKSTETVIGKQDMLRHHNLYPRRARSDHAITCNPAMSQELIDSLEELARRVDAMIPGRRASMV